MEIKLKQLSCESKGTELAGVTAPQKAGASAIPQKYSLREIKSAPGFSPYSNRIEAVATNGTVLLSNRKCQTGEPRDEDTLAQYSVILGGNLRAIEIETELRRSWSESESQKDLPEAHFTDVNRKGEAVGAVVRWAKWKAEELPARFPTNRLLHLDATGEHLTIYTLPEQYTIITAKISDAGHIAIYTGTGKALFVTKDVLEPIADLDVERKAYFSTPTLFLNRNGVVAGDAPGQASFLWSRGGGILPISSEHGAISLRGLNQHGIAVGRVNRGKGLGNWACKVEVVNGKPEITYLPTEHGFMTFATARAINSAGIIVAANHSRTHFVSDGEVSYPLQQLCPELSERGMLTIKGISDDGKIYLKSYTGKPANPTLVLEPEM